MIPQPTRRQQLRFWTFGLRMPPQYRPWAAAQITGPDFHRRRMRGVLAAQFFLVVLPQLGLWLLNESRLHLLTASAAILLVGGAAAATAHRPLSDKQRRLLLAYHGVTSDGQPVQPQSLLGSNPLGRAGLALLTAQVLLFTSGIAVVVHHHTDPDRCRAVSATVLAALDDALERPSPGFPPEVAPYADGVLVGARRVDGGFRGVYYVGAYVRDRRLPQGRDLLGPAVWRVIEPGGVFQVTQVDVSAANQAAREITPSSGYSSNSPPDPQVERARRCAVRAA